MKKTFKLALLGCFSAICLTQASVAFASETFGFAANPNIYIDSGVYHGFNWSGGFAGSSWVNGTPAPLWNSPATPLGYAWSNGGTNLQMSLATPGTFSLDSFDVYADQTKWGGQASELTITGYANGVAVDSFTTGTLDSLPRGAFSTVMLGWNNIDTVTFSESPGENVLLTNFTIGTPVPEPTGVLLLVAGLGVVAARRKRQSDAR